MANGDNQQQQPQYTSDQIKAMLQFANPGRPVSDAELQVYNRYPGLLQSVGYGGTSYNPGPTTYNQGSGGNIVGAQPLSNLTNMIQALNPPQQQAPQQQTQAGYTPDQIRSIVAQLTPSSTPTGQSASPTVLQAAAIPGGQQPTTVPTTPVVTATNPTGSMYNLQQSFQPPQQYRSGGRVPQGYQKGGQVTTTQPSNPYQYQTSTDWFNPEFSLSELGAVGLGGMPTVINPMPNQGQMGQGKLTSSGVYAGPQQATVLGQGPGGGPGQSLTPAGPWNYQPGVLSGPAGSTTIGMSVPGVGSLTPAQSSQIFGLYTKAQQGDTGSQQAMQTWQQGMGMSDDQVNSMMQGYQNNLRGVYTQAYPGGAPSTSPLTATPWGTGTGTTGAPRTGPTPFATAPMPGGQALPAPATGMPGIASFGGMQPPPAPTGPGMMAQGPPGVAAPMAFGGAYTGYTAGVPGIQPAQPAPYTGTVHNDPYMSHAVSSLLGLPANPWHAPDGTARGPGGTSLGGGGARDVAQAASVALATAPKGPLRAQTGGYVRGYQQGDYVQGNEPTEARRGSLTVPQEGSSGSSQPSPSQAAQNGQTTINNLANRMSSVYGGGNQPPAAPGAMGGWHPGTPYGGTGAPVQSGTPGQIPGLPANAQPNVALGMGLNPNAGLPVGGSGYLYAPGQPAGPTPGTGSQMTPQGAQMGNAIAGGIGAIGGAFQQALQKTAQTPWQWQPAGAWANPQNYRQAPPPQFRQEQVPQ